MLENDKDVGHRVREVNDVRALRALAHPFRVRLYELVGREGTLTSTEASRLTNESTASCSFHLRQLGKYGFIEEVARRGGRERRWRRTSAANVFRGATDVAEYAAAERAAAAMAGDRVVEQLHDYLAQIDREPVAWQEASFLHDSLLYLTVDELEALKRGVLALTARFQDRTLERDARPADSKPIAVFAAGFPLAPTPGGN